MPPPCEVEIHVCRYKDCGFKGLGCHGLVPGTVTFVATHIAENSNAF